jgi:hypothetical protein
MHPMRLVHPVLLVLSLWLVFPYLPFIRGAADAMTLPKPKHALWARERALPPELDGSSRTAPNWAGYVVAGPAGLFSDVRASWIEPSISCSPSLSKENDDKFWVGMDGFTRTSGTVEQAGTEGICTGKSVRYDAWYEVYPKNEKVAFTIRAGDRIEADVSWQGATNYMLVISDLTSRRRFHRMVPSASAERSSAEWITETSPSCQDCLEDFGTINYSDAWTTKGGVAGGIGTFTHESVTMIASDKRVMAQPSKLREAGTSFAVTWEADG